MRSKNPGLNAWDVDFSARKCMEREGKLLSINGRYTAKQLFQRSNTLFRENDDRFHFRK